MKSIILLLSCLAISAFAAEPLNCALMYPDKEHCLVCNIGYGVSTENYLCMKNIVDNCAFYEYSATSTVCVMCQAGYVLIEGKCTIFVAQDFTGKEVEKYCLEYNTASTPVCIKYKRPYGCDTAATPNVYHELEAAKGVEGCMIYSAASTCSECHYGFHKASTSNCIVKTDFAGVATTEDYNCATYESGKCTACLPGYYTYDLTQGKTCVKVNKIEDCIKYDQSTGKCAECQKNTTIRKYYDSAKNLCVDYTKTWCLEWDLEKDECTKCPQGRYLTSGDCEKVTTLTGCQTYSTTTGKCNLCSSSSKYFDGSACTTYDFTPSANCATKNPTANQCQVCSTGYILSSSGTCVDKYIDGPDCVVPQADGDVCTTCAEGYTKISNKCLKCESGFYLTDAGACTAVTSGQCATWQQGVASELCASCASGKWLNNAGACAAVTANKCATWDSGKATEWCATCASGEWLDSDDGSCNAQTANQCATWDLTGTSDETCLTCASGEWLDNAGACAAVTANKCATWDSGKATEWCATCASGEWLDSDDGSCNAQTANKCATWDLTGTSDETCLTCASGKWLDSNGDCQAQTANKCTTWTSGTTTTETCVCTDAQYLKADGSCGTKTATNCKTWEVLDTETCSECEEDYYKSGTKTCTKRVNSLGQCDTYVIAADQCTNCTQIRYLDATLCKQVTHREGCAEYSITEDKCATCKNGYSINAGTGVCTEVSIENCVTYSQAGACTKCIDGYYASGGSSCAKYTQVHCSTFPANEDTCTTCNSHVAYKSGSNIYCTPGDQADCETFQATENKCSVCNAKYVDTDGVCQSYTAGNVVGCTTKDPAADQCTQCTGALKFDATTPPKCSDPITATVTQCALYDSTSGDCKTCNANYYLIDKVCLAHSLVSGKCATGQYDLESDGCLACDDTERYLVDVSTGAKGCSMFGETDECTTCTDCPEGTNKLTNNFCKANTAGCKTETAAGVCSECLPGYYSSGSGATFACNAIIAGCTAGTEQNKCQGHPTKFCKENTGDTDWTCTNYTSDSHCLTHKADADECTLCEDPYFVSSADKTKCVTVSYSDCAKMSDDSTCSECKTGYFHTAGTSCTLVDANCKTPADASTCTTCAPGYYHSSAKACAVMADPIGCEESEATVGTDGNVCKTCSTGYISLTLGTSPDEKKYCIWQVGSHGIENCDEYESPYNYADLYKCKTCATVSEKQYEFDDTNRICKAPADPADGGDAAGGDTSTDAASLLAPSIATIILAIVSLFALVL